MAQQQHVGKLEDSASAVIGPALKVGAACGTFLYTSSNFSTVSTERDSQDVWDFYLVALQAFSRQRHLCYSPPLPAFRRQHLELRSGYAAALSCSYEAVPVHEHQEIMLSPAHLPEVFPVAS